MIETVLIFIVFLHFLGDFVCQSDWMAQNKSQSLKPLAVHILVYSSVLFVGLLFAPLLFGYSFGQGAMWSFIYAGINGLAHFAIDFVTARVNKKLWKANKVHWFFVGVGFDQFLHMAILIKTVGILL